MAEYGSGLVRVSMSWTDFKVKVSSKNLAIQYDETTTAYDIFALDGEIVYIVILFKVAVPDASYDQTQNDLDKTDFETNYKPTANKPTGIQIVQDGVAINSNPVLIAGSDGTDARNIKTDTLGRLVVVGAGTAGSPVGGVLSIQGVTSGQPIPITGSVTATNPSVSLNNATIPTSSTQIGGSDGTNLQAITVFDADTGAGSEYIVGVSLRKSSSGGSVLFGTSTDPIRIDPTGTTTQPISGTVTANAGSGTFTISGTVTANIGTTNGLALDTTLAKLTIAQGTALGANTQALIGGSVTTAAPTYTTGNINPLSLNTSGGLRVDGSGVTQPISGTITVTQGTAANLLANVGGLGANGAAVSGNPVRIGGSDGTNTRDILTDSSGRIINIGAAASGAAATGNPVLVSGSDGTNARTLRTATDGTLRIDPSGTTSQPVIGTGTDDTANSTAKLPVIAAKANTLAPSWSDNNMVPLSVDTTGALRITGSISATNPSVSLNNAAIPTSSTQIGGSDGTNLQAVRVFDVDTGAGAEYVVGVSLRKSASGGSVLFGTSTDPIRTDPTGTTTQPISGTITANIGTSGALALDATLSAQSLVDNGAFTDGTSRVVPSGHVFDEVAGTALTENDIGASRIDSKRAQIVTIEDVTTRGQRLTITASNAMKVDGSAVTQPISGTITANIGTSGSLALDATLSAQSMVDNAGFTDGASRIVPAGFIFDEVAGTALTENDGAAARVDAKRAQIQVIEDGTTRGTRATVKAASTAAVATDTALVVAVSPNNIVSVVTTPSGYGGQVEGLVADGAATSGNPVLIGGSDGTNTQTLLTDTSGKLQVVVNNTASNASTGLIFGQANTGGSANTLAALRATTYTEQTTNAQRSVKSASANDTSAGTGARQIVITYYDQTVAGPFTETITLNGTAAVNTTNTNICFIEKMVVISVGSTRSNQGIITLFTTTGGGGSAIGTIAVGTIISAGTVGDNQTLWSHHYVATGKTASITTISSGTTGNQSGVTFLRYINPTVANTAEIQLTEAIVTVSAAGSGMVFRIAGIPLRVTGPARVTLYAVSNGTNTVFFGGFEYAES